MATEEEIENVKLQLKNLLIEQGFKFNSFSPDYLELFLTSFAEVMIDTVSDGSSESAESAEYLNWDNVTVENMMNIISGEITKSDLYSDLQDEINEIPDLSILIENILSNISETWDTNSVYGVGQIVTWNNYLWENIEAVLITPATEPSLTNTKWKQVGTYNNIYNTVDNILTQIYDVSSVADGAASSTEILKAELLGDTWEEGDEPKVGSRIYEDKESIVGENGAIAESKLQIETDFLGASGDATSAGYLFDIILDSSTEGSLANSVSVLQTDVEGNTTSIQVEQGIRAVSLAADYRNDIVYSSSDVTVHAGLLWKNNTGGDIGPEDWDAAKWDAIEQSLFAQYSVKIDNNGYVTGFGFSSSYNNGVPESEFIIISDKFAVVKPGALEGETPTVPFIIGEIDGIDTVGINGNLVVDGTILSNSIQAAAIKAGHIDTDEIFIGLQINSTNYVAGVSGWKINDTIAEFNNIIMSFTSSSERADVQAALNIEDGADVSPGLPSDENLISYWSMDEGSGLIVKDSSKNNADGVLKNNPTWSADAKSGYCLDFDSNNSEYVEINENDLSDLDISDKFSISMWIYPKSSPLYGKPRYFTMIDPDGWKIMVWIDDQGTNNNFGVFIDNGTTYTRYRSIGHTTLLDYKFYHLSFTYDNGTSHLYIDSVEYLTEDAGATGAPSVYGIGVYNGTSYGAHGLVDEVRLYNSILTEKEIKALYLNPGGLKAPLPGADITYDQQGILNFSPSDNMITNPDFEIDLQGWDISESSIYSFSIETISDGIFGSKVLNLVNGTATLHSLKYIPIDVNKTYYGEVWIKVTAIDSVDGFTRMYAGITNYSYDKTTTTDDGAGGVRNINSYFIMSNVQKTTPDTEFVKYTGIISGSGTSRSQFAADAKYVRFLLYCNYGNADGAEMQVAFTKFTEVNPNAEENTINAGDGLAALDTNADGQLTNLDNAAYFPGTINFNPLGSVLTRDGLPAGWWNGYSNTVTNSVYYDTTEEALTLYDASDTTIGIVGAAFPVIIGTQYKLSIKYRATAATAAGFYFWIQELDTELDDGKYAVSLNSSTSNIVVQEATRSVTFISNDAISTTYTEESFTYTPTSTAKWASVLFLNWADMSNEYLFIKYCKVETLATVGAPDWEAAADSTKIDGGNIYAGSSLQIGNLDGESDYCVLTTGDLDFYRYISGTHRLAKSLKRIEGGTVASGSTVTIPGYFAAEPTIMVSPADLDVYDESYSTSNQRIICTADNITNTNGVYSFDATATLALSDTPGNININDTLTFSNESSTKSTPTNTTTSGVDTITIYGNWIIDTRYENSQYNKSSETYDCLDTYSNSSGSVEIWVNIDGTNYKVKDLNTMGDESGSFQKTINFGSGAVRTCYVRATIDCTVASEHGCSVAAQAEVNFNYYTTNSSSTQLATGSLNWIAIGV